MADALDSKSSTRKSVWVQVPPPAFSDWKFRRRFSGLLRIGVRRSPDEKRAHASVEQWEKGKERSQTGYNAMKDRQQAEMFFVLMHALGQAASFCYPDVM